MSFIRLIVCVSGVYAMFLLWAIAQERLSVPFQTADGLSSHKFKSPLFVGTCQSSLSALSALVYILIRSQSLSRLSPSLLLRILQCSVFITTAAPFGFAALSYISYPAMVLGKSCKLIPVLLMNVVLYRRTFKPYKYLVVAMVTLGISIFMAVHSNPNQNQTNLIGLTYLLISLILDGLTNSTQDDIFASYPHLTGQQMMFFINLFCTLLSLSLSLLPLPHIPIIHPSQGGQSEIISALAFIRSHPSIILPLAQFAFTGALGQLFIFETLQHFGSLTLVTITLTRKLFTMLLSVVIYNHKLSPSQWLGTAIVFAGISVEAHVKRKEIHAKRIIEEKEKAGIKEL